MERTQTILIVEDQGLVSDALVELLGAAPGLKVVGVASSIREARQSLVALAPDIMVANLLLEDGSAIELLRLLRRERSRTRVVVLTDLRDAFAVSDALAAGALGYVLKRQPVRELLAAIEVVAMGGRYVSPNIDFGPSLPMGELDERVGLEKLSGREVEVLRLIAAGHTSAEIARRLCISAKTIDSHRSNMYRKLSLRNTVDLMRFATVHGIGIAGPETRE